ncbi:hypothetical protein [Rhizobium ruizarguesonis]|uniref:hypothetical protein n=1 Tax=Rhizobium ruizarguesonis TaxID=2081791 RepID=UPI001031849A|nr:hypothetical protein [Rhizobium ruizarguesonis]TBD31944.1 hypothetical protein ELH19_29800 [Rhizobium ruizarguesonis]TBD33074.1 hypothetical protein ELH18_27385 [Rhizobium ruizarguesonis]TBD51972.1 hypothetical protein ELH15_31710 [Rhizobium ruizarguesonis]TBD75376.1 hypothetical protein ELH14_30855 [Rhizobium ruizarguesonis]TBD76309.1 hypothetical protein ELH13_29250 [Rhizobium ruizarguesonis]
MRIGKVVLVMLMAGSSAISARASDPSVCRAIAPPMAKFLPGLQAFAEGMKRSDAAYGVAIPHFDGEEAESMQQLSDKQRVAYAAVKEYAAQMEITTRVLQKCAQ